MNRDDGSKNRATADAYTRYLEGMDASMRQKVALSAAHLLSEGEVADMGMGSGEGSAALAALYPSLRVVGVDLDPEMVTRATVKHVAPNLRFIRGDVASRVFADGELESILDSSVLHHVTTFGTPPYDPDHAARCLEVQARALATGGVLIVRDFVVPDSGSDLVLLDLSDEDRPSPVGSDAALLRRAAREWRALASTPGFAMDELAPPQPGWARFRLTRKHAVEFLLRKDYREDWDAEIKEEYTFYDRARFEAVFASIGLRVLASTPIRNPWILRNRFDGKVFLRGQDGELHDPPATNYIIVGERVAEGEPVCFRDGGEAEPPGHLESVSFEHKGTGRRRDLVRRPGVTVDAIPFFIRDDLVYVLARTSSPRPILITALVSDPPLDGCGVVPWLVEPLQVSLSGKPIAQTVEEALRSFSGLAEDALRRVLPGTTYYPSPGGLQEEVRSIFVEIEPQFGDIVLTGPTPFSTSGSIRPIEARQVLRAAQVGGLPDARLEINVRSLLSRLGRHHGPWIADTTPSIPASSGLEGLVTPLRDLDARPSRRAFHSAKPSPTPFLELRARRFDETSADGRIVSSAVLELVVPRARSATSIATAPIARIGGRLCLGVDDDDFPAAQCFVGSSQMLVAPAWRLPREVLATSAPLRATEAFVRARFREEHGLEVGEIFDLGGRYHPSPAVTPEVVHTRLVVVRTMSSGEPSRKLHFVPLDELVQASDTLVDGHLRVVVLRAASRLGVLT